MYDLMSKMLVAFLIVSISFVHGETDTDVGRKAPTKKLGEREKLVGKVKLFNHMRNLLNKFDYSQGFSDEEVAALFENITRLEPSEVPPPIDRDNGKEITSFHRRYRMCYAILLASESDVVASFKKEIRSLTKIENNRKIAVLAAELFCLLSKFEGKETDDEVDWNKENEVVDALKKWGINNRDMLNTARAFHRIRTQVVSECKKIYIHTTDVEESALSQFHTCVSPDFVLEAVLMPDAHAGYVAPIGSVIKTKNAVVPAWVGYDVGCGMIAVKISDRKKEQTLIKIRAKEIFDQVNRDVPMGVAEYNKKKDNVHLVEEMESALKVLKRAISPEYEHMYYEVYAKSRPNLGSLGSGNHFIEVSVNGDETWLVIHSGSRGVGHLIGTFFMQATANFEKTFEDTHAITDPVMLDEYMHYQNYCLEFALLNRLSMAVKVEEAIKNITKIVYDTHENLWTNKNHNHCIRLEDDLYLHRKGATSSDKGERGVIPGNMRDGCYLVEGLGNDEFLLSSSHGAGREMSRNKARKKIKLEHFKAAMKGIVAQVQSKTIDESPFAYKNISGVMKMQRDSVKIVKHLKPIINWKGF